MTTKNQKNVNDLPTDIDHRFKKTDEYFFTKVIAIMILANFIAGVFSRVN